MLLQDKKQVIKKKKKKKKNLSNGVCRNIHCFELMTGFKIGVLSKAQRETNLIPSMRQVVIVRPRLSQHNRTNIGLQESV